MTLCPPSETIPEWARAPRDDPRRDHIENCPRCQSWWTEYREFEATEKPPGVDESEIMAAVTALGSSIAPVSHRGTHARPRVLAAARWWIAACVGFLAVGLWWGTNAMRPVEAQWRGSIEDIPAMPFDVVRSARHASFTRLGPDVRQLRWLWIGEDLGIRGETTWTRPAGFRQDRLELDIGSAPEGSGYWQIEWATDSSPSQTGPLVSIDNSAPPPGE